MFDIFVTKEAHAKMIAMLDIMNKEIGAMMIGYIEEGDAFVTDVVITKQTVTGAEVDFEEEGVDMAIMLAMQANQIVIGWFHSHVNMGAFWSGTDTGTMDKLIAHTNNYLVSIVANKKYNFLGRIDYYAKSAFGRERIKVDDLTPIVMQEENDELRAQIQAAITEQVTEKTYVTKYYQTYQYGKGKDKDDDGKKSNGAKAPKGSKANARTSASPSESQENDIYETAYQQYLDTYGEDWNEQEGETFKQDQGVEEAADKGVLRTLHAGLSEEQLDLILKGC